MVFPHSCFVSRSAMKNLRWDGLDDHGEVGDIDVLMIFWLDDVLCIGALWIPNWSKILYKKKPDPAEHREDEFLNKKIGRK